MDLPNTLVVAYIDWRTGRSVANSPVNYYAGALNVYLEMSKQPYDAVIERLEALLMQSRDNDMEILNG